MSIPRSVAEVLRAHVVLEVEAIDRMYLNVYVPHLQSVGAVVGYLRVHRGQRFASTTAVTPMTEAFVRNIDQFINHESVDLVAFQKWQRKDDVTQKYLRRFTQCEGVLYDPKLMQRVCDELSAGKIDRLLRKWLKRLPHPFPPRDRAAGYRYDLSILQAEFSLTQVLDQPVTGRIFFEEVIRENLDIGRPSQVSLVFDRKVSRRTPGRFRTRVITDGVVPSLHVDYKKTRIKQYHKEGQALRTETTINDTRDFAIGRRIENLPELRKIGFAANRRLLDIQRIGHDCFIGEAAFQDMQRPITVNDQRAAALRFADPRVQALLHVLLLFLLVQGTFTRKDVREHLAPLLGKKPSQLTPGRITYDLRRLRLHGLTERIPKTHRYRITPKGLRTATFYTGLYNRSLRTGLAVISPRATNPELPIAKSIRAAEAAVNSWYQQKKLAA